MTREQKLEEALWRIRDLTPSKEGLLDLIRDLAREAIATPPDADTQVVTPDMVRGWLDGFKAALDTAKSITVSVGVVSQADVVGILQSSFDRQVASSADDSRIIGTRVVSVDFLETVGEILRIDLSPEYFAIRAIIEGKDQ